MKKKTGINDIQRNISWIIFGCETGNFENNKTWFGERVWGDDPHGYSWGMKMDIIYPEDQVALGVSARNNTQASGWTQLLPGCEVI